MPTTTINLHEHEWDLIAEIHPKMKILSFTHHHVIADTNTKEDILIIVICQYNESQ